MLAVLGLLIAFQAAKCTHSNQVSDCAEDRCEEINGHELCTECRNAGYIPFNGHCIKYDSEQHSSCKSADGTPIVSEKRCGMCTDSMYLYKGGCYACGNLYPGNLICSECDKGVCKSCTSGFFRNPAASQTVDSCVRCDDTTGVADFVGVAGCLHCLSPSKSKGPDVALCVKCKLSTHKPNPNGDICYRCEIPDCPRCAADDSCAVCGRGYLKGTTKRVCVSQCGVGFYVAPTQLRQCKKCSGACQTCEGPNETDCTSCNESEGYFLAAENGTGRCVSCGDEQGHAGWKGVANCKTCIPPSTPGVVKCTTCELGHSPINGKCEVECGEPSGYCEENSCNVAWSDDLLCSRCIEGYAPIEGMCNVVTPDHGSGCVANKGRCEKCGLWYFLYQGGCYNVWLGYNHFVCLEAGAKPEEIGLCKRCASGFRNEKGICVRCRDPYCKTCIQDTNTCESCIDGYYDPSFCKRCHDDCETCVGEGPRRCLTCPSKKYLLPIYKNIGVCVDGSQCGYGMYGDISSQKCLPCSAGCATCRSSRDDECISCYLRTHFFVPTGQNRGKCIECGDTTNPKGINGCRECAMENDLVKCLSCRVGYILVNGKCQSHCEDPNCAAGSCMVGIGEELYCSLCKTDGHAPVDGICTDVTSAHPSGCVTGVGFDSARSCIRCGAGYFLYMGGCYQENKEPGKSICTWAGVPGYVNGNNYGLGLCNACAAGYENQDGVCRPCTTVNCERCRMDDQGEVCTHCMVGYVLDQAGTCTTKTMGSCTVPDCAECTEGKKCRRCGPGFFLTSVGTCVDNCRSIPGHYALDATEKSPARCALCEIPNCKECGAGKLCAVCSDGYFSDNGVCTPCDSTCATCVAKGPSSCVSCPSGYAVTSESGVGECKKPCTPSADGCKRCDASIDGASYCSVCSAQTAFPLNGKCVGLSARAGSACVSVVDGACTSCADGYFLLSGGCYQVDTYPGRTVCHAEERGVCTKGAHGKMVSESGILQECSIANCAECTADACVTCRLGYVSVDGQCQKCAQGCVTCIAPDNPQMCTLCDTGYYQSTTGSAFTCTACGADNNGMKGVNGCTCCMPPEGKVGSVLCYSFDALPSIIPTPKPSPDPVPSSTRKTAFIAGVSVTAVLLVTGLVSFLLWWFLCRRSR
ncbi:High cysteine membrane protein VSP-like [Giardia duodenalis]|uniref:High cysteine membrane protein VSP-like n=1 Tax=Giardia intestinalis (strain ATCC 50803 / WB clone C6) TaxID=184922 RepID=A8BH77_GIAIC|nr:High cysteine membrane protein VSP-like [Giardia intestinalis]KAE8301925.1 High cysteine membrane protein VSP-like [Giardia intestinalis]|eukprot:XP_001707057.1 High cysteine membrane protein VSP-like [Giardia lamblia ATCC 50803]